jgi:hypothetical protein
MRAGYVKEATFSITGYVLENKICQKLDVTRRKRKKRNGDDEIKMLELKTGGYSRERPRNGRGKQVWPPMPGDCWEMRCGQSDARTTNG